MARSSKPTAQPPPEAFIDIHIINENQAQLASMMRLYLQGQTYDNRIPRINAPGTIPAPAKGTKHNVEVVIVAFDEFTDVPGTLLQLSRVYDEKAVFIAHIEFANVKIAERIASSRIKHLFTGYDFNVLIELLREVIGELPKSKRRKSLTP